MSQIDEYVNQFEGIQKEWLSEFINFMRTNYPHLQEVISYQIPMFKFDKTYIGFSIAKTHFTFHTLDFHRIEELKMLLPKASFGKGSAKVKFTDAEGKQVLFQMCKTIVQDHNSDKQT